MKIQHFISIGLLLVLLSCQNTVTGPDTDLSSASSESQTAFKSALKTIPVGSEPHGLAASINFVYSANTGDQTLSVIDARTGSVVKTLPFEEGGPGTLATTHDQSLVLILNPAAGLVHLLDPEQNHQIIQTWHVGLGPDNLQISTDDSMAYVALTGEDNLVAIQLKDLQAPIKKYPIGAGSADGKGFRALALGAEHLLVSNPGDNNLSLLNLSSGKTQALSAGNDPASLAIASENGTDYSLIIGNKASHTVSIYDLIAQKMTTLTDLGLSPTEIALVPELSRAYITMSGSNEVSVIDYSKQRLVGKVAVGERPVHIYRAPQTLHLQHDDHEHSAAEIWVGNDSGDSITVIDGQNLAVLTSYTVGVGHHKMAFAQNQCFVSNFAEASLSVLQR